MRDLDHYERQSSVAWRFATAHFTVALIVEPEEMDPADSFQFEEDIDAVRNGTVEWFQAGVLVFGPDGELLGSDWLGGCAHYRVSDFYTAHRSKDPANRNTMETLKKHTIVHNFPSMVHEAISAARSAAAKRATHYSMLHL